MNDVVGVSLLSLIGPVLVGLAAYVWTSLALGAVFHRAGVGRGHAWVPLWNLAVLLQLGGFAPWLMALVLVPGIGTVVVIVLLIVALHRINVRLGLGDGFTLLAVLVFPVWASIVGWGPQVPAWDGPDSPMADVTGRWVRKNLVSVIGLLVVAYILLPNIVVMVFSFNQPIGKQNYQWNQFSLNAWLDPCGSPGMCEALGLSLWIGVAASLISTVMGTMAAFALARYRFPGRGPTNLLVFLPMATPEVVMGSSLLTLFVAAQVPSGELTVLIAHILFTLSFVVTTVKARVSSLDPALEQAAADLYATPTQAFWKVTFPLVAPGIGAGAMLAFALSFDDFIVTNFNAGANTITFPMFVWGAAQRSVPVQVNVIGTVMFLGAIAIVGIAQVIGARRRKADA